MNKSEILNEIMRIIILIQNSNSSMDKFFLEQKELIPLYTALGKIIFEEEGLK